MKYEGLKELRQQLPEPPPPVANFLPARRFGNLVFLSGLAPLDDAGKPMTGKIGLEVSVHEGRARARRVGLSLLANLQQEIGDLENVRTVIKLNGFVNCAPEFERHPEVIDGCSEVFVEAFGDAGRHARTSVGPASLPGNISVEVEAIVEVG